MSSKRKVVVIGAGHVGSHCAYALAIQGICDEIVFIGIDEEKAQSQAMDISDSIAFMESSVVVRTGNYNDCEDADIIVMTAGVPRMPGQTRFDVMSGSIACAKDVVDNFNKINIKGIVISVSNPADIIADYIRRNTGLEANRVFSTGTALDTARLRRTISEIAHVDRKSISCFAMGEHGDSSMIPFSTITIGGKPYEKLIASGKKKYEKLTKEYILERTHKIGMDIIRGKGVTEFGIGFVVADVAKAIFHDEHRIMAASPLLQGQYGQEGIHAGVPCVIGKNGIEEIIELDLTAEEMELFNKSCSIIRKYIEAATNE
ncbi:MAG: L-lactate dehydrogenase [Eubacterium sp.]